MLVFEKWASFGFNGEVAKIKIEIQNVFSSSNAPLTIRLKP